MASVKDIPTIDFLDGITLNSLKAGMKAKYEEAKEAATGTPVALAESDDQALILNACAVYIFHGFEKLNKAGRQNMLGSSEGDGLDELGAFRGITRHEAQAAVTTIRFSIDGAKDTAISIPSGTRVAVSGNTVYFATTKYAEIPIGSTYVDVPAACTVTGEIGNGYQPGKISQIVDLIGYVTSVSNTTTSAGGSDIESDDAFAERIFESPSSYSVAGPDGAYIYFAKEYNSEIENVVVKKGTPGVVEIYFTMKGGAMPEEEVVKGLKEYLAAGNKRPLTDNVVVSAPTPVNYSVNLKFYINQSDSEKAETIHDAVTEAVAEYNTWQQSTIGRDINPDELIKRVIAAGAKRVEVNFPKLKTLQIPEIARVTTVNITYGGIEDD